MSDSLSPSSLPSSPEEVVLLLMYICGNANPHATPDIENSRVGDIKWKRMREFNSFCVPAKSEANVYGRVMGKFIRKCYREVPDFKEFDAQTVKRVEDSVLFKELLNAVADLAHPASEVPL